MSKPSYQEIYGTFDLAAAEKALSRPLAEGLNACFECCDRWAAMDPRRPALNHVRPGGETTVYTFGQLRELSGKFAGVLAAHGVGPGDRVAGLLPRTPELLITILAAWRLGAVYQPLFTAFGPKAIEHRLEQAGARLVVTDLANRPKLAEVGYRTQVVTVGVQSAPGAAGDVDFWAELEAQKPGIEPVWRAANDPFLMMFTSGTTGAAKGVEVPLKALPAIIAYMRLAVDLRAKDRFWNIADPGWAYGLYYSVTGPLALGCATTFYDGPFDIDDAVGMIRRLGINNIAGSPTAYRQMIAAGPQRLAALRGQLRAISSAGEPLNPEVIRWFADELQVPVQDHYGQTELGMVVCNHHGLEHPVRAGTAGYPMPGFRVVVLDDADVELPPNVPGELAIDIRNSPLFWFSGYQGRPIPADAAYYRSGDTVELEPDGAISFVGRQDDVITSSGYRIGPFDVERAR
jgi:acetyl-CoA synthetase